MIICLWCTVREGDLTSMWKQSCTACVSAPWSSAAGAPQLSCAVSWGTCGVGGMWWESRNARVLSCTQSQVMFSKHWGSLGSEETPFVFCQPKSLSLGKALDFSWLLWIVSSCANGEVVLWWGAWTLLVDRKAPKWRLRQSHCMWPWTHLEYPSARAIGKVCQKHAIQSCTITHTNCS